MMTEAAMEVGEIIFSIFLSCGDTLSETSKLIDCHMLAEFSRKGPHEGDGGMCKTLKYQRLQFIEKRGP